MATNHISLGLALISCFDREMQGDRNLAPVKLKLLPDKLITFQFKTSSVEADRLLVMEPVSIINSRGKAERLFPIGYQVWDSANLYSQLYPKGYAWNTLNHNYSWNPDTNKRVSSKLKAAIKLKADWVEALKANHLIYYTHSGAPSVLKIHNGIWEEDLFATVAKKDFDLPWSGHPGMYVKYNVYILRAMSRNLGSERHTPVFFAGVGWKGMTPLIPSLVEFDEA